MASLRKRKRSKRALYWIERRKKNKVAATKKTNIIDDLPESLLLLEIFSKLRNPRDILACKNVSKRWNSLIASSSFHHNPSLALILNTQPQYATNDICLEGWKGFELSNYVAPKFDPPVCVLASCKDVLLCMKSSSKKFYIVNPVTMQWTGLPDGCHATWGCPTGLIGNGTKGLYHVVKLMGSTHSAFGIFLFDSMLGTWKIATVQHPPWSQSGWCPTQYQALPFKGALHWLAEDGPVVAYNPNDGRTTCLLIHRSHEMCHASYGGDAIVSETLTVSMGHLRILQLVAAVDRQHLSIWTLVDYKRPIWKQEHDRISFTDLPWLQDWTISDQHNRSHYMSRFTTHPETRKWILSPQPLCCHPHNPLLVYFCLPESIVSLDVATKQMQLITRLSKTSTGGVYWNQHDKVIPMTMQLDPSLIPDHGHELQPRRKHRFSRVQIS